MQTMISYLPTLVFCLIACLYAVITVLQFRKLPMAEQQAKVREWLLAAVSLAEAQFGSGTGKLKLSAVYSKFCAEMPWAAQVMSFEVFSGLVDTALEEMRTMIASNDAFAQIVSNLNTQGATV